MLMAGIVKFLVWISPHKMFKILYIQFKKKIQFIPTFIICFQCIQIQNVLSWMHTEHTYFPPPPMLIIFSQCDYMKKYVKSSIMYIRVVLIIIIGVLLSIGYRVTGIFIGLFLFFLFFFTHTPHDCDCFYTLLQMIQLSVGLIRLKETRAI